MSLHFQELVSEDTALVDRLPIVLACLAVIGGVDNRARLGGSVEHEEVGSGTIARITSKGKIHVQFKDGSLRACRLTELTVVRGHVLSTVKGRKESVILIFYRYVYYL